MHALMSTLVSVALTAAPGATLRVGLISASGNAAPQAQALAAFVQKTLGRAASAESFPTYDAAAEAIATGKVDVAFVPPLAFVRADALAKIHPLLTATRGGHSSYRSVLFAGPDSKLRSLDDLRAARNLKVAWVDSSSAAGYVFPKALLITNQIDPAGLFVDQAFLGNHDAVCKAVAQGSADVGATFADEMAPSAPHATGCRGALGSKASGLRILGASEKIPNDVLTVGPQVTDAERDTLVKATLALASTAEGKKVLSSAFLADGFVPAVAADYDHVCHILDVFKK